MIPGPAEVREAVDAELHSAVELLKELIAIPSLSGEESAAMTHLHHRLGELPFEVTREAFPRGFTGDPEYSDTIPGQCYDDRFNLRVRIPGAESGPGIVFNTHLDVVPPSTRQVNAWQPEFRDGRLHGRGACDAKGQAVVLYLMARALARLGVAPKRELIFHLVVEEENGGNGTLGFLRRGETAAAAVILEPTNLTVCTSVRGAVWFRLRFKGFAGHSGSAGVTVSALKKACRAITRFEDFHRDLLAQSSGMALFDQFANPMPITFGHLESGNWPASAPDQALLEGVLGFLPNRSRGEVMDGLKKCLAGGDAADYDETQDSVEFIYRHDAHVLDPGHPLARAIRGASERVTGRETIGAFPASCDSWFYQRLMGIPAVVFGPGELRHAHSAEEQIAVGDLARAAAVLGDLALRGVNDEALIAST